MVEALRLFWRGGGGGGVWKLLFKNDLGKKQVCFWFLGSTQQRNGLQFLYVSVQVVLFCFLKYVL